MVRELEVEERRKAEERFKVEAEELERQRLEELEDRHQQEGIRLQREQATAEWKVKGAAIRQQQEDHVEHMRTNLDDRDRRLEEHAQGVAAMRVERAAAAQVERNATIAANLARGREMIENRHSTDVESTISASVHSSPLIEQGEIENKHLTDVESPPPPPTHPRVCAVRASPWRQVTLQSRSSARSH